VFVQRIDATRLEEGMHFLTVRAYRHRTDGGPAVFSEFRKAIYIDRVPPVSAFDSFHPLHSAVDEVDVWIRSVDGTADLVHVFADLPANVDDAQVLAMVTEGKGRCDHIDRGLFKATLRGLASGTHTLTTVTIEPTGTDSVARVTAVR